MTQDPCSSIRRATPVLYVDSIERSLPFWEALGFARSVEVPEGDTLGFVILTAGAVEVMLQSRTSLAKDHAALLDVAASATTFLFVEVADLDAAARAVADAPVFLPRRRTFYGATELGVVEPGGHHVTLAQFSQAS